MLTQTQQITRSVAFHNRYENIRRLTALFAGSQYKRRKPARGLIWAPKETRQQKLDRVGRKLRLERALERLYAVMGFRDAMTPEETETEAHFAYRKGMITKDQARELGCTINGAGRHGRNPANVEAAK